MTAGQFTLLGTSVAMVVVAYLFGPVLPPEKSNSKAVVTEAEAPVAFDFNAYRQEALKIAENAPDPAYADSTINHVIDSMETLIQTAFNLKEDAEKLNRDGVWINAGKHFYAIATNGPSVSKNFDNQLYVNTIYCYEKALKLSPEKDSIKIDLAVAYMESGGTAEQVMKGVTILRNITDKDPGNIAANLILGKYGMVSGQLDKAVQRFEKVLSVDSLNADAYLYLAEAHERLGEKEKAIKMLEKCRSVVTDPDFANRITDYINKLKNS